MSDRAIYDALETELAKRYGVRVAYKNESAFMKALATILFFNRDFAESYITTIGRTVYFPTRAETAGDHPDWQTLAHEGVHASDYARNSVVFVCKYLFPQGLALLAALAVLAIPFSLWWLTALAFLLALAPLPAPGRVAIERRGYRMSMVASQLAGDRSAGTLAQLAFITDQFTGPGYYYMAGLGTAARRRAESFVLEDARAAARIASGKPLDGNESEFSWVVELVRANQ